MERTFKEKIMFSLRKLAISLKRNYYIIPLVFIAVCAFYFQCKLYILSTSFDRIASEKMTALMCFGITLFLILSIVAYLNYALVKYGQKRPIDKLIIFYVMFILAFVMVVVVAINNNANILEEIELQQNYEVGTAQYDNYQKYIDSAIETKKILVVQIILNAITFVLVTTAPFVQKALKKITFKKVSKENE